MKKTMKQNKIKLVSKGAVVLVTNINHGKSWHHTLCMTFWNHLCFGGARIILIRLCVWWFICFCLGTGTRDNPM